MASFDSTIPVIGTGSSRFNNEQVIFSINSSIKMHITFLGGNYYSIAEKTGIVALNDDSLGHEVDVYWIPNPNYEIERVGAYISANNLPWTGQGVSNPFEVTAKAKLKNHDVLYSKLIASARATPFLDGMTILSTYGKEEGNFIHTEGGYVFGRVACIENQIEPYEYSFSIGLPTFETEEDLDYYLETGDDSKKINSEDTDDSSEFEYYYDYHLDTINQTNHSTVTTGTMQSAKYKLISNRDKIAWVNVGNGYYELQCTNDYLYKKISGSWVRTSFAGESIKILKGVQGQQEGVIDTNIEFVENLEDASSEHDRNENEKAYNGEDAEMELTELDNISSMIKPYYITNAEMDIISSILFSSDEDLISALKDGLWQYTGNPIESIIDICYYPFNLSVFINSTSTRKLKFGSYVYNGNLQSYYTAIDNASNTFTLINQKIKAIYNDYRDISNCSYSLFIPYYGIVQLDNVVVNKVLKLDAKFDMYTGQLKYYLFIDGTLNGAFECAVGQHQSVLGTDWISKSQKNIEAIAGIGTGLISAGVSAVTGNVAGGLSGASSVISNMTTYDQKPSVQMSGTRTAGLNIYDPLSCYLIIEQYETIKPALLNSKYGKPCYKIGTMATCKGYTEIQDIQLVSKATEEEMNEIISLLKNGVII